MQIASPHLAPATGARARPPVSARLSPSSLSPHIYALPRAPAASISSSSSPSSSPRRASTTIEAMARALAVAALLLLAAAAVAPLASAADSTGAPGARHLLSSVSEGGAASGATAGKTMSAAVASPDPDLKADPAPDAKL
ncbi:hypothetical protein ACP4OV_025345 [Aristida adscensionis]